MKARNLKRGLIEAIQFTIIVGNLGKEEKSINSGVLHDGVRDEMSILSL